MLRHTRQRIKGGLLATVGFILSPLSWWNDLLVNVPLAYAFATVVALLVHGSFVPALVVGYWLTNVLGFVLLQQGTTSVVTGENEPYTRKRLTRDLLLSVGYTVLILVLVEAGVLTFPEGVLP
ncbi:hypothetical protein [Haloarchaeobius sp. HME9146]|uniref:hypothetical protein n=1 Tax=Haloarchaeobius sp. HME9146 TaxID=2978732 RepID=UPI0021C1FEAA|nr:hypothetical protein [Haloarchaeobius sp. HME9146]MCT9094455.1 hypothetical protein [Haloarchaeobius sp. HME9146]